MSSLRHWLWLSTRGSVMQAFELLERYGSPEAAYFAGEDESLPAELRRQLADKSLAEADRILHDCEALGIRILTIQDTEYPERLRQIHRPPCVLYVRGRLPQMDEEAAIAMVGARKASPYGVMAAQQIAMDLARQGALIVSGSAAGIDAAALQGALKGGGRVVSVLGNGIDVIYPAVNQDLYEDVSASGALISEYPPGTPPNGAHFPVRNRIIAGLSVGVVVVEGDERSGSLITARWALDQDRDVFAVPGPIDAPLSKGPNGLIRRSEAKLIQDAWDVLSEYEYLYPARLRLRPPLEEETARARMAAVEPPVAKGKGRRSLPTEGPAREPAEELPVIDLGQDPEALTDDEAAILRSLQEDGRTAEELVERTGIPARRILSALTMLQVRELVGEEAGKRFSARARLKEKTPGTGTDA